MEKLTNRILEKKRKYFRRKNRVNTKIKDSTNNPRIVVNKSNAYIYAQVIDVSGNVLASANDLNYKSGTKKERARLVWQDIAKKLSDKSIEKVVFDRNWYLYHGRVLELVEWIRSWWINL